MTHVVCLPGAIAPAAQRYAPLGAALGDAAELHLKDVNIGYGDLTHDVESVRAAVLATLFADVHVQRHAAVHHVLPPDLIYTPRHVKALRALWSAAEPSLQE